MLNSALRPLIVLSDDADKGHNIIPSTVGYAKRQTSKDLMVFEDSKGETYLGTVGRKDVAWLIPDTVGNAQNNSFVRELLVHHERTVAMLAHAYETGELLPTPADKAKINAIVAGVKAIRDGDDEALADAVSKVL